MRLFVRIAETGSLSAAAQSLAISQPTASRQLKQLEQLLGAQLVRRSTHELTLTDSGNRFLEDARAMLAHCETSLDTLRKERRELTGSIRVAVPVAVRPDHPRDHRVALSCQASCGHYRLAID
jgi:molybdate transport repressor ModE-like protein